MTNDRLKWTATGTLVVGTVINNLGVYPLGAVTMSVAGVLWLIASIRMRDRPLIVTNACLSVLGIASLVIGVLR